MAQFNRENPFTDENDSAPMTHALKVLKKHPRLRRTSRYQLKIDGVNFFPDKGTICYDGEKALPERGIEAFIRILKSYDPDVSAFIGPLPPQSTTGPITRFTHGWINHRQD